MPIVTQTSGGQSSAAVNGQSIDYIAQQVIQSTTAVPDSLVQTVLQQVINDFYNKSNGWQEVVGPYNVAGGVNTIYLNPVDQYSQCHYVRDAFLYPDTSGGTRPRYLIPLTTKPYGTDVAAPTTYFMDAPDEMVLYPLPDQSYGNILYVVMSLMPVLNAGQLPNISITHHFDGLYFGTMYRLGMMQNKPWTVKDRATLNEWNRTYRQQIMIARDVAKRAFSRADSTVWFPNFAGRASQNPVAAGGDSFRG